MSAPSPTTARQPITDTTRKIRLWLIGGDFLDIDPDQFRRVLPPDVADMARTVADLTGLKVTVVTESQTTAEPMKGLAK